jgi:hypothetical protein
MLRDLRALGGPLTRARSGLEAFCLAARLVQKGKSAKAPAAGRERRRIARSIPDYVTFTKARARADEEAQMAPPTSPWG